MTGPAASDADTTDAIAAALEQIARHLRDCADGRPIAIEPDALPLLVRPLGDAYNHAVGFMLAAVPAVPVALPASGLRDPVTLLPVRAVAEEQLRTVVARIGTAMPEPRRRSGDPETAAGCTAAASVPALLVIDVERLRSINQAYGHAGGDMLLRRIAERLQASIRPGDLIARGSSDEFLVVVEHVAGPGQLTGFARRIILAMERTFPIGDAEIPVTCHIGMVLADDGDEDPSALLDAADDALRRAKLAPERYAVHELSDRRALRSRFEIERKLRAALEDGGIRLVFQPITDLRTGRWLALEGLARCDYAGGTLPPAEFIPVAEEGRMIGPLGDAVMRLGCQAAARLRQRFGPLAPIVGVNVSPRQLLDPELIDRFIEFARQEGVDPGWIKLEITESGVIDAAGGASNVLVRASAAGFALSVDDFGAGSTSLTHFRTHDFDEIKIDQAFVAGMARGSAASQIVSSIIEMARRLDLNIVAEGVETAQQLSLLRSLGCPSVQGYLISRPLPFEQIADGVAAALRDAAAAQLRQGLAAEPDIRVGIRA